MKKNLLISFLLLVSLTLSAQLKEDTTTCNKSKLNQSFSLKSNSTKKPFMCAPDTTNTNLKIKTVIGFSNNGREPLIIIDGKRSRHGTSELDANDIKSISVLKGISATKKYGKKGKNGVILITTKKILI